LVCGEDDVYSQNISFDMRPELNCCGKWKNKTEVKFPTSYRVFRWNQPFSHTANIYISVFRLTLGGKTF